MQEPKVFISYSWSSPDHEAWVLNLAKDLVDNGVDAIIDKWSLDKGHDANAFMEQMATNDDIKKVILVCDRVYKEKADARKGGAGTEAQIITPQIYASQDQNKFVAVLSERDEEGEPFVPAFYASRIHIDLSDPTEYGTKFEELVRWVYGKPLYVRPALGKAPSYLLDTEVVRLATSAHQRRAIEALRSGRAHALSTAGDYLESLLQEMEKFRIAGNNNPDFDLEVFENIANFIPYRNEYFELVSTAASYAPTREMVQRIHRFLEGTIRYMYYPEQPGGWSEWDFDNFRFLGYEMYLGTLAILVRAEQFDVANILVEEPFYVGDIPQLGRTDTMNCVAFMHHLRSFDAANNRSNPKKITKVGDVLHERNKHTYFDFKHMCSADIVLHLRSRQIEDTFMAWYAVTPIYLYHSRSSLELFARCRSRRYFERAKSFLGVSTPEQFKELVARHGSRETGDYGRGPSIPTLVGIEGLCTMA